jgi:ABC-2 type transport system permease protein
MTSSANSLVPSSNFLILISMNSFSKIFSVFKRELGGYFNSPVAYIIIVFFLLLAQGFTFSVADLLGNGNASLTNAFFQWHPWLYLVFGPAIGMRLWSEEYRQGTWELLATMPISMWHAIVGKFLAVCVVWAFALICTLSVVWTVNWLGNPDPGPIIMGYIGSYLLALSFVAITMAVSAFTESQVVCFIVSVAICLFLTLCGFPPLVQDMLKSGPELLSYLVLFFVAALIGGVSYMVLKHEMVAFISFIAIFLVLAVSGASEGLTAMFQNHESLTTGSIDAIAYSSVWTHLVVMTKGVLKFQDLLYFLSIIGVSLATTNLGLNLKRN